jgi:hypothetical protein
MRVLMSSRRAKRPTSIPVFALAGCLIFGAVVAAQGVEPELFPPAVEPRPATPPPIGLAKREAVAPLAVMDLAMDTAAEELEELARWNTEGRLPLKDGFARHLPEPQVVTFDPAATDLRLHDPTVAIDLSGGVASTAATGDLIWGAEVRVEGAHRLRLHLSAVDLPAGSLLWVYNDREERVGPLAVEQLEYASELWTPSVAGPVIRLEMLVPVDQRDTGGSFIIDRVLEILPLDPTGRPLKGLSVTETGTSCLVDAQCVGSGTFGPINNVQQAIALVRFVEGGSSFQCTGGLLADTDSQSTIPYLLTANHCISKQSVANTVIAYFDYYAGNCPGPIPDLGDLPRTLGSTLLATGNSSSSSDFTLLRLDSLPAGRFLLGWDHSQSTISNGKDLHRISHPSGMVQHYTRSHVNTSAPLCQSAGGSVLSRSRFIYSTLEEGDTQGGSSGAPAILGNGKVVGQLSGGCGDGPLCDPSVSPVDGAFFKTWDQVKDFLDPTQKFTLTVTKTGNGSGTVTSSPAGINCGNTCSSKFLDGTEVVLTANPATGSSFSGWSGDCDVNGEVTMTSNKTCTATFSRPVLSVDTTGTGNGAIHSVPLGISCGTVCSKSFDLGSTVELLAKPAADSAFDGWSGHADCSDGTVTMSADKSCTAGFRLLPTYTLTVSSPAGDGSGAIRSDPGVIDCGGVCEDDFVENSVVRLLAVPDLGSQLGGWSGDADCADGLLTMVDDRTCTGTFDICTIDTEVVVPAQTVTDSQLFQACNVLTIEEGGFVVADGGSVTLRAGNSVVLPSDVVVETGGSLTVVIGPPLPD